MGACAPPRHSPCVSVLSLPPAIVDRRAGAVEVGKVELSCAGEEERLLVVGATNRPQELDEAARRRLVKRLYIPLPDLEARQQIITNLLHAENNSLSAAEVAQVGALTEGYSGADMKSLCSEAAMGPVRSLPLQQITTIHPDMVRPVNAQDFRNALQRVRPSVSQDDLGQYVKWNQTFGHGV